MTNEAPSDAVDRIDRALTRIEAAARQNQSTRIALRARHDALRHQVGDALAALDALIAADGEG